MLWLTAVLAGRRSGRASGGRAATSLGRLRAFGVRPPPGIAGPHEQLARSRVRTGARHTIVGVGKAQTRATGAAQAVLVPGERLATSGIGWACERRDGVPLLFQGRRQYWFVLTDRRLLVFRRRRGGPTADDLVLAKRYDHLELDAVKRLRPLFQIHITTNAPRNKQGARHVLEFRPGHRGLAAELVRRVSGSTPVDDDELEDHDDPTVAAFWGDR